MAHGDLTAGKETDKTERLELQQECPAGGEKRGPQRVTLAMTGDANRNKDR